VLDVDQIEAVTSEKVVEPALELGHAAGRSLERLAAKGADRAAPRARWRTEGNDVHALAERSEHLGVRHLGPGAGGQDGHVVSPGKLPNEMVRPNPDQRWDVR
jgi:hypothetical protein